MENIITTQNLTRVFTLSDNSDFTALNNVTIEIPKGRLTILKGRSGSGKTTLMNILGALDEQSDGKVFFDNIDLSELSEDARSKFRRENVGFVFQSVALIPIMNAYENVEFALRLAAYKGDMKKRAVECLHLVGLEARMNHMPQQLSGGEQQRVAIARAIAHMPKVVFADEPTAELDTATGLRVIKMFKELSQNQEVTIVMTTHDMGLIDLGDRVFELEDGRIKDER